MPDINDDRPLAILRDETIPVRRYRYQRSSHHRGVDEKQQPSEYLFFPIITITEITCQSLYFRTVDERPSYKRSYDEHQCRPFGYFPYCFQSVSFPYIITSHEEWEESYCAVYG